MTRTVARVFKIIEFKSYHICPTSDNGWAAPARRAPSMPAAARGHVTTTTRVRAAHAGGLTVSTATAAAVPMASSSPMSRPTP
jgi:hypothetical protein